MLRFVSPIALAIAAFAPQAVAAGQPTAAIAVAHAGWTVRADTAHCTLDVSYDGLGTLMQDVRLHVARQRPGTCSSDWSVRHTEANRLEIATREPRTAWTVDLTPTLLRISSTSIDASLSAKVPIPAGRIPARLIDPGGTPLTWAGTKEVVDTYGGTATRIPTYLPARNPDVMTFSMGVVSSSWLHSLFDRPTDTAVDFSDRAVMARSTTEPQVLDVTVPVPGDTVVRIFPQYYTRSLGVPYYVPFEDSHFQHAPVVWNSWPSYYEQVTEADVVRNADWLAANLKPYGFQFVVLDDGYDRGRRGEHYWIEKWDRTKFPHGPQWLARYIKRQGLRAGLWLVPNAYAGALREHPDWYLRDRAGRPVLDYATPALDSTHPDVMAFLKREFTILDSWGFEYYKFDGEFSVSKYVPSVDRSRMHDPSAGPFTAYRTRLKAIRDTIGANRFLEGCPAGTPLNGVGYFNSYFNGEDVYSSWAGMYSLFSSMYANAFLNHLVVYVMPGEGMELSPPMTPAEASVKRNARVLDVARVREDPLLGFGTSLAEARTLVSHVALSGVAYPLGSVMPELPAERVELLKKTLPTLPILPTDLFSRGSDISWDTFKRTTPDKYVHNYPEVLDLKVNAVTGVYDVIALTNWRSNTVTRDLSFADKLGLATARPYVVFDFWNQKLLGVFTDHVGVEIQPHDTRVLTIRPVLDRPQLIGISRHISGAYSVLTLAWDPSAYRLRGASRSVPSEDYTLFVHVPEGVRLVGVTAATDRGQGVPVRQRLAGGLLQVSFTGQAETVQWILSFSRTR